MRSIFQPGGKTKTNVTDMRTSELEGTRHTPQGKIRFWTAVPYSSDAFSTENTFVLLQYHLMHYEQESTHRFTGPGREVKKAPRHESAPTMNYLIF